MSSNITTLSQTNLSHWLQHMSAENAMIAHRAKMTIFEMLKCFELSRLKNIPLNNVLEAMALFKETRAHLRYKEDFSIA